MLTVALEWDEQVAVDQAGDGGGTHLREASIIQHETSKWLAASLWRVPFVSLTQIPMPFPAREDNSLNAVVKQVRIMLKLN